MNKHFYWFDELRAQHFENVGKKCANLGELTHLGLHVPYGFVISIKCFEDFLEKTGLKEKIKKTIGESKERFKNIEFCNAVSSFITELIEETEIPEDMEEEITNYYNVLCNKIGEKEIPVAVRSSGVVSMPGQMDTYLNIIGANEVIKHIKKVWASTYSTRAITWRIEKDMTVDWSLIGVAIMQLVQARTAGVVMTVQPTTGDTSKILIEGNWGFGESVVSGEITPDSFFINKDGLKIIDKKVSHKNIMVINNALGTKYIEVPNELKDAPCLTDDEILEIAKTSLYIEKYFGVPQDIEWAIDKNYSFPENIFWIQARPARFVKKQQNDDLDYIIEFMVSIFK